MSRIVAALILLITSALLPVSASGEDRSVPALRLTALTPVQVVGHHFETSERVRLRATVGDTTTLRTLRATRLGAFRATFAGISITDRCSSSLTVRAVGARGSRATVKLPQLACPPSLATP